MEFCGFPPLYITKSWISNNNRSTISNISPPPPLLWLFFITPVTARICKYIYCVSFGYVIPIKRFRSYITRITLLAPLIYFGESRLQ